MTQFAREVGLEIVTGGWRSVLAGAAVAVAVGSVVAMSVIGDLTADAFLARDAQLNGRPLTLATQASWGLDTASGAERLIAASEARIAAAGGSYAIVSEVAGTAGTIPCTVVVTTAGLADIRRLPILEGVWLDDGTIASIVVNAAAASRLGGVGDVVRMTAGRSAPPWSARIVGVVSDGLPGERVYVALDALTRMVPGTRSALTDATLLLRGDASAAGLTDAVLAVADDAGIPTADLAPLPASQLDGIRGELDAQRTAFVVIGLVTCLISALGLLGIAVAGLRERMRELAVRRALGARRGRVFAVAICTSLAIASTVGLLTVAAAAVVLAAFGPLIVGPGSPQQLPSLDPATALLALATSSGVSLVAGLAPAIAAARVDPASVLRA